jgi:putative ABC transport system substrate-binding protein
VTYETDSDEQDGSATHRMIAKRLTLAVALGFSVLWAPLAQAQSSTKAHRLGILSPATEAPGDPATGTNGVPSALRELGYRESENLVIERRFAEGKIDRLPALARELVQLRVDVIVVFGAAAVQATRGAASAPPVVFMAGADPIAEGWVASLARPGGNITGVVIAPETNLVDKRLQLLKEAVPRATHIAILATDEPTNRDQVREAHRVASALNLTLVVAQVREANYERAFGRMVADQAQALLVLASPILNRDRKRIIDLAAKHRLPAVYQWRQYADEGGLMAYGSSITTLFSRVAVYVDRIFKGAKPSELPVEQPTSFELVVNMKTARGLGLTLPPSLLVRANYILE